MSIRSRLCFATRLLTRIAAQVHSKHQINRFSLTSLHKMPSKDKYSDPKLRDEVKEEIKQGDKGGEPGQWSARKAQMMAKEYKKRGGDYNTSEESKDESQKNLDKWGEEEWQTKEGSGEAKQEDGSMKRYLPKKAWEQMDEKEKKETDKKKQEEGKDGKQFVQNTGKAKQARKNASEEVSNEEGDQKQDGQSNGSEQQQKKKTKNGENSGDEDAESDQSDQSDQSDRDDNKSSSPGQKRGRNAQDEGEKEQKKAKTSSKDDSSKKTIGSKHDKPDAPAQQGSKDRLPKKGQKNVHWKAMPGWVEGEVVEVVKSSKSVEGKEVKASNDDPKVVLKSKSSGKICVHKADNVYFD